MWEMSAVTYRAPMAAGEVPDPARSARNAETEAREKALAAERAAHRARTSADAMVSRPADPTLKTQAIADARRAHQHAEAAKSAADDAKTATDAAEGGPDREQANEKNAPRSFLLSGQRHLIPHTHRPRAPAAQS